jgi:hypothetical protein
LIVPRALFVISPVPDIVALLFIFNMNNLKYELRTWSASLHIINNQEKTFFSTTPSNNKTKMIILASFKQVPYKSS